MDEELEALRWLTVGELAAARRYAIRKLNFLDRFSSTYPVDQAALQRTIQLIREVQEERRLPV